MQSNLVFTFICKDRTGIIDAFSSLVSQHNGNWLESRMSKLAGQFAGIVQVSIDHEKAESLKCALLALTSSDLSLLVDIQTHKHQHIKEHSVKLSIIGLDRPGIIKEFSQSLAQHQLNVVELKSLTESAAMSGNLLFKAWLTIEVPNPLSLDNFQKDIEDIANQLDIDYNIEQFSMD